MLLTISRRNQNLGRAATISVPAVLPAFILALAMNKQRNTYLAIGALALLFSIWGYNWVVMKEVLRYVDPLDFSALRTLFGALTLFCVMIARRQPLKPVAPGATLLLGLLQTAAYMLLIQLALVTGGAGKTSVLVYTMPFWMLPIAWFALGERIRGMQWPALVVAAIGLMLLLQPWSGQSNALGSILGLAGGLVWAISTVLAKRMRAKVQFDLLSLSAWQTLMGSIVLCVCALAVPSRPIDPTLYFFGALIFNAVLATGLAWVLWLYALNHLPVNVVGMSSLGVPMIGVFAAWLQLGERPNALELTGMLLIGIALLLMSFASLRRSLLAKH